MKKITRKEPDIFILSFAAVFFLFFSCVSNERIYNQTMTAEDLETLEIIGFIETNFDISSYADTNSIIEKSYEKLLTLAKEKYNINSDVVNVIIEKKYSKRNLWYTIPETIVTKSAVIAAPYITINAKGLVIKSYENN